MVRTVVGLDVNEPEIIAVLEEHERDLIYPEFNDTRGKSGQALCTNPRRLY